MPKIFATLRSLWQFIVYLIKRFDEDSCLTTAAALSYTTLLSLVPLAAVILAVLTAFPAFQHLTSEMQDFIFSNFVPATGEIVQDYLQQFTDKASELSGPGIIFLILTALFLMNTIDAALNRIWRVRRNRNFLTKFLIYWAVLTLGPVLLAVSIVLTSYLTSLPLLAESATISGMMHFLLTWLPLLATTLALTMLYVIVPNLTIPLYIGISGGVLAALLFEAAKKGFTLYVASVPTYATVYGALSVIPIFLVWMYISWTIVLLGAETTYCLANFEQYRDRLVRGNE